MITQKELKKLFYYDPDTGEFIRLTTIKSNNNTAYKGCIAGYRHKQGYMLIKINSKQYKAHRLAFLYMTGSIPDQVDHINHIRDDNRWINLRSANASINAKNASRRRDNNSGISGVNENRYGSWVARINVNCEEIYLGTFKNFLDAVSARKSAEMKYGFHPNHGASI